MRACSTGVRGEKQRPDNGYSMGPLNSSGCWVLTIEPSLFISSSSHSKCKTCVKMFLARLTPNHICWTHRRLGGLLDLRLPGVSCLLCPFRLVSDSARRTPYTRPECLVSPYSILFSQKSSKRTNRVFPVEKKETRLIKWDTEPQKNAFRIFFFFFKMKENRHKSGRRKNQF